MNTKIRVYHFNNGSGGGVLSVIRNLIAFSENREIENHVIYTIETSKKEQATIIDFPKAASVQVFHYNKNWNFYHTCRELAKLVSGDKALVLAHDWLELGMCSQLGLQYPVVYFLHGNYGYYYDLAIRHNEVIDIFIPVSEAVERRLTELMPTRTTDIHYLRFPVPEMITREPVPGRCNIAFIGRLSSGKGYDLLPGIAAALIERNVSAQWYVAGADVEGLKEQLSWPPGSSVYHYGETDQGAVAELLRSMDFFVLPSLFEGMPVTVIEAMKAGVIPIVNDIEGGIEEIVIHGETGYRISDNDINGFANRIAQLCEETHLAERLRQQCISLSDVLFHSLKNTSLIEKVYGKAIQSVRNKKAIAIYGSRLDRKWIPNTVVNWLRNR